LKIKALAEMPRKKAKFEVLINQALTSAIGLIAPIPRIGDVPEGVTLNLCISATGCIPPRAKTVVGVSGPQSP
jgi:hypothetical protein